MSCESCEKVRLVLPKIATMMGDAVGPRAAAVIASAIEPTGIKNGWRPMSEAPRDGTQILGRCEHPLFHGEIDQDVIWWDEDMEHWRDHEGLEIQPTHWQHLPGVEV